MEVLDFPIEGTPYSCIIYDTESIEDIESVSDTLVCTFNDDLTSCECNGITCSTCPIDEECGSDSIPPGILRLINKHNPTFIKNNPELLI